MKANVGNPKSDQIWKSPGCFNTFWQMIFVMAILTHVDKCYILQNCSKKRTHSKCKIVFLTTLGPDCLELIIFDIIKKKIDNSSSHLITSSIDNALSI